MTIESSKLFKIWARLNNTTQYNTYTQLIRVKQMYFFFEVSTLFEKRIKILIRNILNPLLYSPPRLPLLLATNSIIITYDIELL